MSKSPVRRMIWVDIYLLAKGEVSAYPGRMVREAGFGSWNKRQYSSLALNVSVLGISGIV